MRIAENARRKRWRREGYFRSLRRIAAELQEKPAGISGGFFVQCRDVSESETDRLRFQFDAESREHVALDRVRRVRALARPSRRRDSPARAPAGRARPPPPIARPFQPHRSISQPAASFTCPSGCRYDTTSGSRALQRFERRRAHHRILEETARVAEHRPVGQLRAPHRDDRIEDGLRVGGLPRSPSSARATVGIIGARRPRFRQPEHHRRDHEPPAPFPLEETVAIAERASIAIEFDASRPSPVRPRAALEALAHFEPVRADVLDRRRAHRARNQREVFEPGHALRQASTRRSRASSRPRRFDVPGVVVFAHHALAAQGRPAARRRRNRASARRCCRRRARVAAGSRCARRARAPRLALRCSMRHRIARARHRSRTCCAQRSE